MNRGVYHVADNGGSMVGAHVASGDEGSFVADFAVMSHIRGGGGGDQVCGQAEEEMFLLGLSILSVMMLYIIM